MKRPLALFAIALALQACVTSSPGQEATSVGPPETTSPPPGTLVPASRARSEQCHEDFGICVSVPAAWTISWDPLRDGTIGDIFLVGSWSFGHLPECRPIPRGEVLIVLSEVVPRGQAGPEYAPRPDRFEATRLRSGQVRKGCVQPMAELFRFLEADRALYAWIMAGPELSTGVRTEAETVLSSLTVEPPS
jgi:hypothetical protein